MNINDKSLLQTLIFYFQIRCRRPVIFNTMNAFRSHIQSYNNCCNVTVTRPDLLVRPNSYSRLSSLKSLPLWVTLKCEILDMS